MAAEDVEVFRCPGAWELPQAALRAAQAGGYDAVIAIGCVIRGDTPHFDYIAGEAARGLADTAYRTGVPVIFGVLTTENLEQALARSSEEDNKGEESVRTALEMVNLLRRLATD